MAAEEKLREVFAAVRRDPLKEKKRYLLSGQEYTEEEHAELKKPTVDIYLPRGHGVMFPDGS